MPKTLVDYQQEIIDKAPKLSKKEAKAVRDFIQILEDKKIDPDQFYFWTPRWQEMEREADEDKRLGRYKDYSSVKEFEEDAERRIRERSKRK